MYIFIAVCFFVIGTRGDNLKCFVINEFWGKITIYLGEQSMITRSIPYILKMKLKPESME